MERNRKFLFKLASHLGYTTVAELENTMSYNEFLEWVDYYSFEPFGFDRIELQLSQITELLYRTNFEGDMTAIDFMISVSQEAKQTQKKKQVSKKVLSSLEAFGN